ncbi:MAG: hypothetical protein K2Y10_05715 [Burkholderiaceae bacterium]|nr:hypothetical protein [Burkholderiaceae bacterium]
MQATTKQLFKKAYGIARKQRAELICRSSDVYQQVDAEAYGIHLERMIFGRPDAPIPANEIAPVRAAATVGYLQATEQKKMSVVERLALRRSLEEEYVL